MSEDTPGPRRTVVVPRKVEATLVLTPDANSLLADALSVIATEIVKFKAQVNKGQSLDLAEARVLQGYIKSLVDLSKEERERAEAMDWSRMTDEQLLAAVDKMRALGGKVEPK